MTSSEQAGEMEDGEEDEEEEDEVDDEEGFSVSLSAMMSMCLVS